jgi:hypothetical protein
LGVVRIVLCLLARLLPLASLHPSFLQQTPLLGQSLPLLSVFPLILTDQCLGLVTEDVLEFTELADPGVAWRAVKIGVLLLDATFVCSVFVQLRRTALRLRWRRCLLLWLGTLLRWGVSACRRGMRAVYPRTRLRALRGYHRCVGTNRWSSTGSLGMWRSSVGGRIGARRLGVGPVLLAWPDHLVSRVGPAGEGELRLVCAVLGGFLLQQAHVLVSVGRRGCLGVGDGGRDDAALLRWT